MNKKISKRSWTVEILCLLAAALIVLWIAPSIGSISSLLGTIVKWAIGLVVLAVLVWVAYLFINKKGYFAHKDTGNTAEKAVDKTEETQKKAADKHEEKHAGGHSDHNRGPKIAGYTLWTLFTIVALFVLVALWPTLVEIFSNKVKVTPNNYSSKILLVSGGKGYYTSIHLDEGEKVYLAYYNYNPLYKRDVPTGEVLVRWGDKIDIPPALYYRLKSANGESFFVDYTQEEVLK